MSARTAPAGVERSATGATRARFADGRRHFQHGPIDLILEAWGAADECARAYEQAWQRFQTVLPELVEELPILRKPVAVDPLPLSRFAGEGKTCPLSGAVAKRMWNACAPFAEVFITPMAAVAGAVADEIIAAMIAGRTLSKAYVNNGGDIAIHLAQGERFETGIVGDLAKPKITATAGISAADPVRGIATSGWRGRSFSLGIADAVTVLAQDAAAADAATTLVANAVNIEHPAIQRRPARELDPDSDLGEHLVTVEVGALDEAEVRAALDHGEAEAERLLALGHIHAALLDLSGRHRVVGAIRCPRAPQRPDVVLPPRAQSAHTAMHAMRLP